MMLTHEQLKRYQSDGFVVVKSALSEPELVELRSCVGKTIALGTEAVNQLLDDEKIHFDRSEVAAPPRAIARGMLQDIAHRHELFWSLSRSSSILDLVEPIVGPDISMYLSRCVFKPKRDKSAVIGWHQDGVYWWGVPDKVSVCVALDRCTRDNGCLNVISETHLGPMLEHTFVKDDVIWLQIGEEQLKSLPAPQAVPMGAGDVLLFHPKLVHQSEGSISDMERRNLYFVYQPAVGAINHRKGPPAIVRGPGSENWQKFPGLRQGS